MTEGGREKDTRKLPPIRHGPVGGKMHKRNVIPEYSLFVGRGDGVAGDVVVLGHGALDDGVRLDAVVG